MVVLPALPEEAAFVVAPEAAFVVAAAALVVAAAAALVVAAAEAAFVVAAAALVVAVVLLPPHAASPAHIQTLIAVARNLFIFLMLFFLPVENFIFIHEHFMEK